MIYEGNHITFKVTARYHDGPTELTCKSGSGRGTDGVGVVCFDRSKNRAVGMCSLNHYDHTLYTIASTHEDR